MSQDLQVTLPNGETHTKSKVFYYAKPTSDTVEFFSAVHRGSCQETTNAGLTLAAQVEQKIRESGRYAPNEESAKHFAEQTISTVRRPWDTFRNYCVTIPMSDESSVKSLNRLIEMSQSVRAPVMVLATHSLVEDGSMNLIRDAGVYISPASEVCEGKLREMNDLAQELKKSEDISVWSANETATEEYPGMNIMSMDWEDFKELERHGLIAQSSKGQSFKDWLRSWKRKLTK
ncbi:hypothetical protein V865_006240 [Kwoniella europaea PYCC6329]|uniref:Uncharacterized protein n=1 Tax=Kwoniella europaea PYCC6329 TaxID=1423913 RepID=A0AAX4KQ89_9TREE